MQSDILKQYLLEASQWHLQLTEKEITKISYEEARERVIGRILERAQESLKQTVDTEPSESVLEDINRTAFIITIDDEYCKYEYGFEPKNSDNICIKMIVDAICDKFDTKMKHSKLLLSHCR